MPDNDQIISRFSFDVDSAAQLLVLFSNSARVHVLAVLINAEKDVGTLAGIVGLSQSALSQHLKRLRDGNLVTTRRNAKAILYSCSHPAAITLISALQAETFMDAPDTACAKLSTGKRTARKLGSEKA